MQTIPEGGTRINYRIVCIGYHTMDNVQHVTDIINQALSQR